MKTVTGVTSCASITPVITAAATTQLQRGKRTSDSTHVVLQYLLTSRYLFYSPTSLTINFNIRIVSLQRDLRVVRYL